MPMSPEYKKAVGELPFFTAVSKRELAQQNKIIDEWVAERNKHIGETLVPPLGEYPPKIECWYGSQMNEWVDTDLIRHYCDGCGERNPLYRDGDYAKNTRWGGIIAPPLIQDAIGQPYVGREDKERFKTIKNCIFVPNGARREFFKVMRPGDKIKLVDKFLGTKEMKSTRPAPARSFDDIIIRSFINQRGELVSTYERHFDILFNHDFMENGPLHGFRNKHRLTDEEREMIERGYDEETRRGADTLYWEDVKVGEKTSLHPVGPQSVIDSVACLNVMVDHAVAYDIQRVKIKVMPEMHMYNPEVNAMESGACMHLIDGNLGAILYTGGPACGFYSQAEWLLGRMLTDWAGDDGFVTMLDDRVPIYPINGETYLCKGQVTNKSTKGDAHLVDLDVRCENLDGEVLLVGTAQVQLPSLTDLKPVVYYSR